MRLASSNVGLVYSVKSHWLSHYLEAKRNHTIKRAFEIREPL